MTDAARVLWDRAIGWFGATYALAGEPAWEGAETGWVLRIRRAGRPLATLSPAADGGFGALVVLGPSLWDRVRDADLSDTARAAFDAAKPYPDGRWLWLRIDSPDAVDDVCTLVAIKSPPRRRAVVGAR